MKKEWIRSEEERHQRKLKRLYKQQKKMDKFCNNSIIERKKNRTDFLPILSNQLNQYKQPVIYKFRNICKIIFVFLIDIFNKSKMFIFKFNT
jgi:hypothetical protein